MLFFNLFTMVALVAWTPTPWWFIGILFFFWAIMDIRVKTLKEAGIKLKGRK